MRIDAHFHVWDPATRRHAWIEQTPALYRRFGVEEVEALAHGCGIERGVLVQVLAETDETEEFLALAQAHEFVAGVVGWVDLSAPDVGEAIARLRDGPGGERLVGVRHLVQSEPDPGYLGREAVVAGLRQVAGAGCRFDLLVTTAQLPAATRLAAALDDLPMVLDHGAKPPIATGELEPWRSWIARLAELEHVSCKLSGLVTEAGDRCTVEAIAPYADHLLECFGPRRLLFGSDWPVCTVAASYGEVVTLAGALIERLSDAERAEVLGANAARFYGLAA
ncbi:MAG TPA: amidohydrolase family protein [Acidimicrobiales bacterium]|nr:amidohydrolase family protein [Acidimicrobiales bacterium]